MNDVAFATGGPRRQRRVLMHARGNVLRRVCVVAFGAFSTIAWATNGLNLTSYGAESTGLGGADLAVTQDALAVNANPAAMALLASSSMDLYVVPFRDSDSHTDQYGNDQLVSERNGFLVGAAYAQALGHSDFAAGIALLVQGGTGYHYKNLETAFGTRDEASSLFGVSKLVPGVSWRINDRLSLGANLNILYAKLEESLFPQTSVFDPNNPSSAFFGLRFQGAKGFGYDGRVGLRYRARDDLTLAMAYTSKGHVPITGGELQLNESAAGAGIVTYRDARLQGVSFPQEVDIGAAYRPIAPLLLALEVKWLDWSGALRTITVEAKNPDQASAPSSLSLPSQLDYHDQYVLAGGIAWRADDQTTLRGGVNWARRPSPDQNLSPTFATIQSLHLMAGLSRSFGAGWSFGSAVEYQPMKSVMYTNPAQPFGVNAKERNGGTLLTLMISRNW